MPQITQILLFSLMSLLERSKTTVCKRHFFKKKFAMEVLSLCLPYVKRYFQKHQLSAFFFMAQLSFWETVTFQKKIWYKVLRLCRPYVKRYFREHQLNAFFFMGQITRIMLLWEMLLFERSKMVIWEQHLFIKEICYGTFEVVSTFRKKVFWRAPVKCVFLYGSNNSDSAILLNATIGDIKDHSLRTTPFPKKHLLWKIWICVYLT